MRCARTLYWSSSLREQVNSARTRSYCSCNSLVTSLLWFSWLERLALSDSRMATLSTKTIPSHGTILLYDTVVIVCVGVKIQTAVFCVMTPCGPVGGYHFGGNCYLIPSGSVQKTDSMSVWNNGNHLADQMVMFWWYRLPEFLTAWLRKRIRPKHHHVPRLADRNKDPFVTCPALLPAPYGELPALLPAPPVFLLTGPAVSVEPGSGVHWSQQSPASVCDRTKKILVNILVFLRIRQEKDSAKEGGGKK